MLPPVFDEHSKKTRTLAELACRTQRTWLLALAFVACFWGGAGAVETAVASAGSGTAAPTVTKGEATAPQAQTQAAKQVMFIHEYRVEGAHLLPKTEVENAVYPFLGPGRTPEDVEQARTALEKAYQTKGYQAVVQIPQQQEQQLKGGVIVLQVSEGKVGRLRVRGSRYFSLEQIKNGAPSLAEGRTIDFNDVTKDIVALNKLADRRVTPSLRPGVEPGTWDIDLTVKDTLPLHGSLELNNQYSANTTPIRLNGSVSYNNLWQLGHTIGGSFQVAPERIKDGEVYSGYYTAPIPEFDGVSFTLQGRKQNSDVASVGGLDSVGLGEVIGTRLNISLPGGKELFHSLTLGLDYKNLEEDSIGFTSGTATPVTYFPLSVAYSATFIGTGRTTDLNASLNFSLRGTGTGKAVASGTANANQSAAFGVNRYRADDNYVYFRGDLAQTQDLPGGCQVYGKVQGQIADQPLVDSEQFGLGGQDTVRGYLESAELGDNGFAGSVEFRTPSLSVVLGNKVVNEWRFYVFGDGGCVTIRDSLPDQTSRYNLASVGVGSRIRMEDYFNASIDVGLPLISLPNTGTVVPPTRAGDLLFSFRVWADF